MASKKVVAVAAAKQDKAAPVEKSKIGWQQAGPGRPPARVVHDRGGHPSAYTDEVVKAIYEALLQGAFRPIAARLGGVSAMTFENWMKGKPEFAAMVEEAEARCEFGWQSDLNRLARGIRPGEGRAKADRQALMDLLQHRFHSRWKDRAEITVRIEEDATIEELEQKWSNTTIEGEVVSILALPEAGSPDADQV